MTRILRLLLIAAVALPLWQSAAAQEVKPERMSSPKKLNVQEMKNAVLLKNQHKVVPKERANINHKASQKAEINSNSITVLDGYSGTNIYIPDVWLVS